MLILPWCLFLYEPKLTKGIARSLPFLKNKNCFHFLDKKANNSRLLIQLQSKRNRRNMFNFLSSPLCWHTYLHVTFTEECFPPNKGSD